MAEKDYITDEMEWRVIPGFENYAVSDNGQVKRLTRSRGAQQGKILKPKKQKYNYVAYDLRVEKKVVRKTAQRLVAMAFLGQPPLDSMEAAHKDGNPRHNFPDNLYWATHYDNMKDMERHGTIPRGEKHYASRITSQQVVDIRKRYADGDAKRLQLSREHNVCQGTIGDIVRGVKRKHEEGPITIQWGRRGSTHHSAKLTELDIRDIRCLYVMKTISKAALARKYGISQGMIWKVITRKSWTHIKD